MIQNHNLVQYKMKTINIIATTISGSIKDWKKIDHIKEEFEKFYAGEINVHVVDSHREAREKANELAKAGKRIIVSAGGSGTFNSVLEGCRLDSGFPEELRLAFLRKGSADLIGKVLNIPDELTAGAKIISNSIEKDRTIESDVIEITIDDKKYHFIGFGGIGIFGIVPYFSESRFKKYYKGLLGQLFGDRGSFLLAVNLAALKYYKDKIFAKVCFIINAGDIQFPAEQYSSVIIMNGDLGDDFPLARGISLGSGSFRAILLRDLGLLNTARQMISGLKEELEGRKEELGVEMLETETLEIAPESSKEYMVNVDGLLVKTKGKINYGISDRIRLITG